MGERTYAIRIANTVLDDYSRDPDSDMSVLARQLLRSDERITELEARPEAAQVRVNGLPCPDTLAQIIRKVDGSNNLGAGELAERILSALEQPNTVAQPDGWRDISTAPKDGTWFLGYTPRRVHGWPWLKSEGAIISFRWWGEHEGDKIPWFSNMDGFPQPTHWMPLPPAPEKEG